MDTTRHFLQPHRCLLDNSQLHHISQATASGILDKRIFPYQWKAYHFSLTASHLWCFQLLPSGRRGHCISSIPIHNCTVVVSNPDHFTLITSNATRHAFRVPSNSHLLSWVLAIRTASAHPPPPLPIAPTLHTFHPSKSEHNINYITKSSKNVDHVMCVVHGIGVDSQLNASNIRQLQHNYLEVMARVFPDVPFHIEFLPIHWRDAVRELGIHRKLQNFIPVTPGGRAANPLRSAMCEKVVDYVFYTNERYRLHMMRAITRQLNEQVEAFKARRPHFDGRISILAHSLGAALVFDLACRKARDDQQLLGAEELLLSFDVEALFFVGNPLGILHGLDPSLSLSADVASLPFRIYNVFKLQDPIATRMEPMSDPAYAGVHPVTVPSWHNMGAWETRLASTWRAIHRWVGNRCVRQTNATEDMVADDEVEYVCRESQKEVVKRGRGWRVDYALQPSSILEEVSCAWGALWGHTEYWCNRDVMLMMVSCIFKSSLRERGGGMKQASKCADEMGKDFGMMGAWLRYEGMSNCFRRALGSTRGGVLSSNVPLCVVRGESEDMKDEKCVSRSEMEGGFYLLKQVPTRTLHMLRMTARFVMAIFVTPSKYVPELDRREQVVR